LEVEELLWDAAGVGAGYWSVVSGGIKGRFVKAD
jgi:hypothetical protein